MRILTLTNLYPNPFQPHLAPFNRQALRLLAARHPVQVIAPILWTDELRARWRGAAALPRGRRVSHDGLVVDHPRYCYPPKVGRAWYGACFRRSARRAFRRAVEEFRPDLVYAPWAYPDGWAAVALARQAGLPAVIKVHGSDVLHLPKYPGRRKHTAHALQAAEGIVAVSRDLAAHVVACGADPARVRVIYDGVDAALFRPGPRGEARARAGVGGTDPLVLFIGNLVPVKAPEVLLEACALLAKDQVRFSCCLVGQGPLRAALEKQSARLGLEGRVRLVGPLPHARLPDWYRAADVFALPSHSEGLPSVLLEAAACGTPFVASRVGGIPEIVHLGSGRNLLVPPGDARALAGALAEILKTSEVHSEAGGGEVRSWDQAVDELAGFFDEIVRAAEPAARPRA